MLNTKDNLSKSDSNAHKYIMLGYFERLKGYRVYNIETHIVKESIHFSFDVKFDSEKLNLVEKFPDLEITYLESKGKTLEASTRL